jgi:TctA family transporter
VDPDSAILFVFHIVHLLAEGVEPADIVDADETAFLLYPQGSYTWAGRGSEAMQVHVAGNEKKSSTVMAAVTMDRRRLPLFTLVQGKTVRADRELELDPQEHTRRRTVLLGG